MERNSSTDRVAETQSSAQSQQDLERIHAAARESRTDRLTNLVPHTSVPMLRDTYEVLNRKAAAGGEINWSQYGEGVEGSFDKSRMEWFPDPNYYIEPLCDDAKATSLIN